MHALKALVIAMGLLIIVGMGLVVWGFARQATQMTEKSEDARSSEDSYFETQVDLPNGCTVDSLKSDGQGGLLLLLKGQGRAGEACAQIILLDAGNGEVRGRIGLQDGQ
ncbi:hypothetical protein [Fodinicurvata sediminis]|uniref:hypothetical protein n=1 Tax=Fodinicurvata sediminis TaxID=1121832 RepID=UPI0003FE6A0F|nr:hypothetical protein [Fodinicurvata sediminis]